MSRQTCAAEENKGDPTLAPWLNDPSIRSLQVNLANQRREAHARPPKEGVGTCLDTTETSSKT